VGSWSLRQGFSPDPSFSKAPIKRFFRVGTVARTPWTMVAEDGSLSGYCPLMLEEMASRMDFGYELILPTDNSNDFGKKGSDGQWSGVVGVVIIVIIRGNPAMVRPARVRPYLLQPGAVCPSVIHA
jgi:hypothetical protein